MTGLRIDVTVPGPPVSWRRRWGVQAAQAGRPTADELKARAWRQLAAGHLALAYRGSGHRAPHTGPVAVEVDARWPRPDRRPESASAEVWATGQRIYRPTRNRDDLDRSASNVLDALVTALVLEDDGLVVELYVRKRYAGRLIGENATDGPGTRIQVWEVDL